jgi:hypothetical protein
MRNSDFPALRIGCIYKNKQYMSYLQYPRDSHM